MACGVCTTRFTEESLVQESGCDDQPYAVPESGLVRWFLPQSGLVQDHISSTSASSARRMTTSTSPGDTLSSRG